MHFSVNSRSKSMRSSILSGVRQSDELRLQLDLLWWTSPNWSVELQPGGGLHLVTEWKTFWENYCELWKQWEYVCFFDFWFFFLAKNPIIIQANLAQKNQTIFGFGGAFTDYAGWNIRKLNSGAQQNLIRTYFDPEHGRHPSQNVEIL